MSIRRFTGSCCLLAALVLSADHNLHAKAIWHSLKELAQQADVIVKAKVESIETSETSEELWGFITHIKIATANVERVFKGNVKQKEKVRFIASPTWTCDNSTAIEGETVVLFLEQVKRERKKEDGDFGRFWKALFSIWGEDREILYQIVGSGQGRMEYGLVEGKPMIRLQTRPDSYEDPPVVTVKESQELYGKQAPIDVMYLDENELARSVGSFRKFFL
ncbi:MAG: hypothetical protein JSV08_04240 [Acidobacteriota bacterium]|nr:MAG: hypothetical protein JSV08_04240 [Acidobacteriota bacterium]